MAPGPMLRLSLGLAAAIFAGGSAAEEQTTPRLRSREASGNGNGTLLGAASASGALPRPRSPMEHKGKAWPDLSFPGAGEMHIFAIGDWGGMDGSLEPIEGRPRIIAYQGGHTPGPHVFPRTRWNLMHNKLLCSHKEFVGCFESHGSACPAGCGFVPEIDARPQQLVAEAFKARAAEKDPQYILNVGDNFYWGGIEKTCGTPMGEISPTAKHQFDQVFEGMYQGAGLSGKKWLSVLGNHDWGGRVFNNGWDQQIAYTWASSRWVMPAPYWSQHVEYPGQGFDVDIFFVDSNMMDAKEPSEDPEHNMCSAEHNPPGASCASVGGPPSVGACKGWFWSFWREQQAWLEQKLAASRATWKIVVTHFPCGHEADFYRGLRTKYGMDLLVTGHRHDQELFANSDQFAGASCLVTGGGGGITSEADATNTTHWYGEGQYGFYDITITKDKMLIESVNWNGTVPLKATIYPAGR